MNKKLPWALVRMQSDTLNFIIIAVRNIVNYIVIT